MRLTVALAGAALLLGAAPAIAQDGQDGGLVMCNARGECERVEDVCEVASSERDQRIERGPADRFGSDELGQKFPLVLSQDRLQPDFRVDDEEEEAQACLALFGPPGQQAAVSPGAAAPAPLPGPPLPLIAGPPVVLGVVAGAAALGLFGGGENASGTSTTATTTTPGTTGGAQ